VARVAGGGELGTDVIRIGGPLKNPASDRKRRRSTTLELAPLPRPCAIFALHRGVRAEQRETILVILYLLYRNIPTLHRVALRAIRAHLPLVNVRVALFAILAHIGEHWLDVALRAFHFFVQAPQRITCLVVIEFRNARMGFQPAAV